MLTTFINSSFAKNKKRKHSISLSTFLFRFVCWSVLPLLLISIFLATYHIHHLKKMNDYAASSVAHNVMTSIDRQIETQIAGLQLLATSPLLDDTSHLSEFYKEALGFYTSFGGHVILVDSSMRMIFNTRLPFGTTLPELPHPKGHAAVATVLKTGKPATGDMFLGPIANEQLVAVAVPVIRSGQTPYLLLSIIEISRFQQSLEKVALPADLSISVIDGDNKVMAHLSAREAEHDADPSSSANRLFIRSSVTPWSVELDIPNKIYSDPIVITIFFLISAILLVTLVSVKIAGISGRQLTKALEALINSPSLPPTDLPCITEIESIRITLAKSREARKAAENVLRESENKFKYIFESANVGKSITLPTGKMITNRAFARMLGYSKEEMVNKTWQELTPPEEIETVQNILTSIFQGEKDSARFTKRYMHKNGSYVWGDVSVAIRHDSDGRPLHFIATMVDITERHTIQIQLTQALNYIETIIEKSPIGIATLKADGRIITANQALANIVGGTVDKIKNRNIHNLDSWRNSGMLNAAEEVLRTGMEKNLEFQYVSSFNKECRVSCLFVPFSHAGEEQLLHLITDVSQSKKAEEERQKLQAQLQQAQKIEAIGQLAGGVAHDYNNELSVIIGFTELAMEGLDRQGELYAHLEEVLSAAHRSADITRQLLAFARKQTVAPKVLDLNSTIPNMLKMLKRLIGEGIDLAWRPATDLWSIKIDPYQIDQILANLCVNARDAIENVGKITIETKNLRFDKTYCADHAELIPGEYVLLAISDDGSGMTEQTMEKIFEPFFTTKALNQGTGLGLATVHGIVKQNFGFINVYSEPMNGTTFKIYLPRHKGQSVEILSKSGLEIPSGHGETILLVEDDISILSLQQRILKDMGYTVLAANSPKEATQLAEEHAGEIRLLLTDVVMPEMNGRELSAQLHRLYPHIKTIFMSGYTANVIAHHGVLEEGVSFISKPFTKQELASKVRETLDSSTAEPSLSGLAAY